MTFATRDKDSFLKFNFYINYFFDLQFFLTIGFLVKSILIDMFLQHLHKLLIFYISLTVRNNNFLRQVV